MVRTIRTQSDLRVLELLLLLLLLVYSSDSISVSCLQKLKPMSLSSSGPTPVAVLERIPRSASSPRSFRYGNGSRWIGVANEPIYISVTTRLLPRDDVVDVLRDCFPPRPSGFTPPPESNPKSYILSGQKDDVSNTSPSIYTWVGSRSAFLACSDRRVQRGGFAAAKPRAVGEVLATRSTEGG